MSKRWIRMIKVYLGLSLTLTVSIWLLLSCASSESPGASTPPTVISPFQTDATLYTSTVDHDPIQAYAYIQNHSPSPIWLEPLSNTRILQAGSSLLLMGVLGDKYHPTRPLTGTQYMQPLQLAPAQRIILDISGKYTSNECYVFELYYRREDTEEMYVMYSNIFHVKGTSFPYTCPCGTLEVAQPLTSSSSSFELNHFASMSSWLVPYCYAYSDREAIDFSSGDEAMYAFATLERLTSWGTWEVLHPERAACGDTVVEPVELNGTQIVDVWAAPGFDWEALVPGWYRWHLRYYDTFDMYDGRPHVGGDRSWFTDLFYIGE